MRKRCVKNIRKALVHNSQNIDGSGIYFNRTGVHFSIHFRKCTSDVKALANDILHVCLFYRTFFCRNTKLTLAFRFQHCKSIIQSLNKNRFTF